MYVFFFFWWFGGDFLKKLEDYQMFVYLFGVRLFFSCLSFFLKKIVEDNRKYFNVEIIDIVNRNFYVDDCFKLVVFIDEVVQLVDQLFVLLRRGGFWLMKWLSNC